ncbi:hypothetical protein [Microcoleus sp. T3_D1]|uniref:hypothetical protein n=1 Tax=Microcoleus sp. T3_D1 TaxID=3055427 RepID=UPI002FD52F71
MYLKRVRTVDRHIKQVIATSHRRSYRQVGDPTDKWAILPTSGRSYRQVGDPTDNQSIEPTLRRSYRLSGELTFFLVNLKKQESF